MHGGSEATNNIRISVENIRKVLKTSSFKNSYKKVPET